MNVVIDTSIWSEYFRRKESNSSKKIKILKELILQGRAVLPGIVKQELLSGIKEVKQFKKLDLALSGFTPLLATNNDHIQAAKYFNTCRLKGIQGSFSDFLICSQSTCNRMSILTNDKDFNRYSKYLPIKLWNEK